MTQELQALSEATDILEWEQILKQKNHYQEIKATMAEKIDLFSDKAKTLDDKFTKLFA